MGTLSFYKWVGDKLQVNVYVIPNAKKDEVIGPYLDAIKIKIKAQALENKANQHLINLMAKWFGVPKTHVSLLKGDHARQKLIEIQNPKIFPEWMGTEG